MPNRHIAFPWSLANRTATMPDKRRLLDARMPSLKIVLTGGSAVARGLPENDCCTREEIVTS